MSANEALAHIESQTATKGLESAYKAFNEEVGKINQGTDEQKKQAQMQELEAGLKKDGLLPELAVYWGAEHAGLVGNGDRFSLRDLDEYRNRSTTDSLSKAMASSLMEQHAALRNSWWDFDSNNVTQADLGQAQRNLNYFGRDFAARHTFAKFAEELKANDYSLFNKISGADKDKNTVSIFDLNEALKANETAKKYGNAFLTEDDVKNIKEARTSMYSTAFEPYRDGKSGAFTLDLLKKLPAREKSAYEQDANESPQPEAKPDGKPEPKTKDLLKPTQAETKAADPSTLDELRKFIEDKGLHMDADRVMQLLNQKVAEVRAGDGFDRIARRELRKLKGDDFSEADVLKYSDQIAKFNGQKDRLSSRVWQSTPIMLPEYGEQT